MTEDETAKVLADCAAVDAEWAKVTPDQTRPAMTETVKTLAVYAKQLAAHCRTLVADDTRLKEAIWPGLPKWEPTEAAPQQDFYEALLEAMRAGATAGDELEDLQNRFAALEADRDHLLKFKAYVHARLDAAGVSVDPESPHKAEGCRVGGRLDEVIGERDALRTGVVRHQCEVLHECIKVSGEIATGAAEERAAATTAERDRLRVALGDVLASLANYRRCLDDFSLSPYVRENGRHRGVRLGSPWAELIDDGERAAALLPPAKPAEAA